MPCNFSFTICELPKDTCIQQVKPLENCSENRKKTSALIEKKKIIAGYRYEDLLYSIFSRTLRQASQFKLVNAVFGRQQLEKNWKDFYGDGSNFVK